MSESSNNLIVPLRKLPQTLVIPADKIVLAEKGVEIISASTEEFMARFDKIVFVGKNKKTTFKKERR